MRVIMQRIYERIALSARPIAGQLKDLPPDRLRQGYGGPPKLHAKAEGGPYVLAPRGGLLRGQRIGQLHEADEFGAVAVGILAAMPPREVGCLSPTRRALVLGVPQQHPEF